VPEHKEYFTPEVINCVALQALTSDMNCASLYSRSQSSQSKTMSYKEEEEEEEEEENLPLFHP